MKYVLLASVCLFIGLCSCGDKSKVSENANHSDSMQVLQSRQSIYNAATEALTSHLKMPQHIKLPQLHVQNDSIKILSDSIKAYIIFPYSAENEAGAFTTDIAAFDLVKKDGKWISANNYNGVRTTVTPAEYEDFDMLAGSHFDKIGTIPIDVIPAAPVSPSATSTPMPLPR